MAVKYGTSTNYADMLANLEKNKGKISGEQYERLYNYASFKQGTAGVEDLLPSYQLMENSLLSRDNSAAAKRFRSYIGDKFNTEYDTLSTTRSTLAKSRVKASTIAKYGIALNYSNGYEDQVAKRYGYAPASFDVSPYLPINNKSYNTSSDAGVDAIMAGYVDRQNTRNAVNSTIAWNGVQAEAMKNQPTPEELEQAQKQAELAYTQQQAIANFDIESGTRGLAFLQEQREKEYRLCLQAEQDYRMNGSQDYYDKLIKLQESVKNMDAQIEQLKGTISSAQDYNAYQNYYNVTENEDFEEVANSSNPTDMWAWAYHNRDGNMANGQRVRESVDGTGAFMTEEEYKIYAYLFGKDKENKTAEAATFISFLKPVLDQRAAEWATSEAKRKAEEHPIAASIESVLYAPANSFAGTLGYAEAAITDRVGGEVNPNTFALRQVQSQQAVRQGVGQGIRETSGNVAATAYDIGMSIADSIITMGVSGGWSGGLGEAQHLTLMFGNTAASAMLNAYDRGATQKQAVASGFWSGVAEVLFEKVSLDSFIKISSPDVKGALILNILKQAGIEASEETATEIANAISDYLIMGGKSNYEIAVKQYVSQGFSEEEAKKKAMEDIIKQIGVAFIGGAVSGGLFGAGGTIISNAGSEQTDANTPMEAQAAEPTPAQPVQANQNTRSTTEAQTPAEVTASPQTAVATAVNTTQTGAQSVTAAEPEGEAYTPNYKYELAGTVNELKNTEQDYVYDYTNNTEVAREEIDAYKQYVNDMRKAAKEQVTGDINAMEEQASNAELLAEAAAFVRDPSVVTEGLTPKEIKELGKYAVYKRYAQTELLNMAKRIRKEIQSIAKTEANSAKIAEVVKKLDKYIESISDIKKIPYPKNATTAVDTITALEDYRAEIENQLAALKAIVRPSISNKVELPNQLVKQYGRMLERQSSLIKQSKKTLSQTKARITKETNAAMSTLRTLLKNERKGKNLTREYRTLIDSMLENIDTKSNSMTDETRAELEALQQYAKETYTDKGLEIPASLQSAYKRLNQTQVSTLTVARIEELTNQILEAKKQDQIDRKEAKTLKGQTYAEAEKSFDETRPKKVKWDLTSWAENPQTWAQNFGQNFRKNVIDPIQNGAITHGRNEWYVTENILKPLQDIVEKEFGNKEYGKKNETAIKEPTLGVELKPREILEVYNNARDVNGFDALINDELYDPVKLKTFVRDFKKNYPQYFKAYELLRKLFDFYEPQINATFNHIKGHDLITEQKKKDNPNYYPLHKDGFYYHTPTQSTDSVNTTPSFTFARTGGGKIDFVNPLWVAQTYHQQANRYVSYSAALHDANILMQSETVQNMISEATKTKEEAKKISGFMREYLYAVARGDATKNAADKFIQNARSRVSGAILTANLEVAAKQFASYFGALEHVDARYLFNPKNFGKAIQSIATKQGRAALYEAFPDLYERIEEGYLMAESGKLKGRAKLVRWVDAFTVASIAYASQQQAGKTGADASEIFHRALWDTQPMYDSAFRSSVQRSEAARWFLQFSTQQFQQQNQVKRAIKYFQQGDKAKGTKAIVGVALNIASFSAMAFGLAKAFPKKGDEDKSDWRLFLEQIAKATTGTLFPMISRVLGSMPNDFIKMLGGDFEITSGYDISSPVVDEIINATKAFSTLNGDKTIYGKIIDIAKPFLILAGIPAANAEKLLSRTAEVIFPDFEYDYWKKEATATQLFDDYMNGGEFPTTLPSSRTQIYDAYFDMVSSGNMDAETVKKLAKVSNAINDASYDEKVDDMVSALESRYRKQLEEQHPDWSEYQIDAEIENLMPSIIESAQDFYSDQFPLKGIDEDVVDLLTEYYDETGDNIFLLDDDSFSYGNEEFDYPDDIQQNVSEGYTVQHGENAGEEIDGINDVINSTWFQNEDADAQEQIIRDTINAIMDAVEFDIVYEVDPYKLAEVQETPDTSTYYRFNRYWRAYDPNDEVITSLDGWSVYPHIKETFTYEGNQYEFTASQQEALADTTYTALRKYFNRLDAASAKKIIELVYAAFKEYVANGRTLRTDEILDSVYYDMDEKYEWS